MYVLINRVGGGVGEQKDLNCIEKIRILIVYTKMYTCKQNVNLMCTITYTCKQRCIHIDL